MKLTNLFGGNKFSSNKLNYREEKFELVKGKDIVAYTKYALEYKERFFVKEIVDAMEKDKYSKYLFAIVGIRCTGKTVAGFQIINNFAKKHGYDKCIFIQINKSCSVDELVSLVKLLDYKYFFIDEITNLNDFIENGYRLSDCLRYSDKRILIAGTSSLVLFEAKMSSLNHRIICYNSSPIAYSECKYLMGSNFSEYIYSGGVLDKLDNDTVLNILVENVIESFNRNKKYYEDIYDMSPKASTLRSVIFYIYYMCIIEHLDINHIKNLDRYKRISEVEKMEVLANLGVLEDFKISEFNQILEFCERIKLVRKIKNKSSLSESTIKYYVTVPAIVNAYFGKFKDILEMYDYEYSIQVKGDLFECAVLNELSDYRVERINYVPQEESRGNLDLIKYFEEDIEIDFLVQTLSDSKWIAVECKNTCKFDRARRAKSLARDICGCVYKVLVTSYRFTEDELNEKNFDGFKVIDGHLYTRICDSNRDLSTVAEVIHVSELKKRISEIVMLLDSWEYEDLEEYTGLLYGVSK